LLTATDPGLFPQTPGRASLPVAGLFPILTNSFTGLRAIVTEFLGARQGMIGSRAAEGSANTPPASPGNGFLCAAERL
jgi:hypothetical protein